MYRNYIFDFYGTLADIRTDEEQPVLWKKMSEIYSAMGAVWGPEELKRAFRRLEREAEQRAIKRQAEKRADSDGWKASEESERQEERSEIAGGTAEPDLAEVFAGLYLEKGVSCDEALTKLTAVTFRALSREYLRVYDGVKELLGELKRRGRGVYLLSNAQTYFTRPEIDLLGLSDFFDGILISSEEGCRKPSVHFFQRLLERYGLNPSECIMIGNDEGSDIAGARAAGMDSLYIHTAISPEKCGAAEATYQVMDGDFRRIRRLLLREAGESEQSDRNGETGIGQGRDKQDMR